MFARLRFQVAHPNGHLFGCTHIRCGFRFLPSLGECSYSLGVLVGKSPRLLLYEPFPLRRELGPEAFFNLMADRFAQGISVLHWGQVIDSEDIPLAPFAFAGRRTCASGYLFAWRIYDVVIREIEAGPSDGTDGAALYAAILSR